MKRLLCAGSGDIYQLVPVFRDGENGQHHNPEFMMVEWYRLGFDYLRLAEEASQLVSTLLGLGLSPRYQTYQQVFQEHLGVDPLHDDSQILLAAGQVHSGDTFDPGGWGRADLLDWLFASAIQPLLGEGIVVIHEYPAEQAALARLKPQDPRVALRFEIFFNGIELANGFHELADPVEQQRRFEVERLRYAATGREVPPLDQALLAALGSGLPDCSGVALGFDRVVMLAAGRSSIREVMSFPYDRI